MHKSCKKNTVAYSSPPLHSQKLIFFYWKPATAPPPLRGVGGGGVGGFAPLSLPLNDIFSQKLTEYSSEPRYNEQFGTCEFLLSEV